MLARYISASLGGEVAHSVL